MTPWGTLQAKLYDPVLTPEQFAEIQHKVFQVRNRGPLYIGGAFISYSRADSKFVDMLYQRLQDDGASVWLDRHDMVAGRWQQQVSRAIRLNDVVVLVLSKASVTSEWVAAELAMALEKEKEENRDVLCPISLDDAWKGKTKRGASDWERWQNVESMNVIDFSGWKSNSEFNGQFDKLLRGMKIYYEPKKG